MDIKETPKQMLPSPIRTQGDGMENASEGKDNNDCVKQEKKFLGDKLIYRPSHANHFTPLPPVITGKIVNLVPKNVTQSKKDKILLGSLKGKEPKFVPYEPYKAAVKPIIPNEKKSRPGDKKQSSKVVDLKLMVHALPVKDVNPEDIADQTHTGKELLNNDERKEWELEIKSLKEDILLLREENGQLESQLKFQAQVNGELKNLLVAAVGEDLETRMHLLTEDKLQLARALLNSAQRLSTHQEQTEWLAGQCEVWRSKFLASSLMVEELARWKAALCQKVTDFQEALKRLLEEHNKVRESMLNTYRNLSTLRDNFDINTIGSRRGDLRSTNILDLAAGNLLFSEALRISLLGSKDVKKKMPDFTGLDTTTCAEKIAENLLANPTPLLLPDAACSAVMGAAVAVGGQMLLRPSLPTCCSHCSGEVKLV